jgi:hypothetical protein
MKWLSFLVWHWWMLYKDCPLALEFPSVIRFGDFEQWPHIVKPHGADLSHNWF